MKKFMLFTASALAILAAPAHANDYDDGGWYLRGNAGYGAHHDMDFDQSIFTDADVESEGNVAGSLGIGYEFGEDSKLDNWRIELDGDSLFTDLGKITQNANSYAKLRTNTLMVNAIYDFADEGRLVPYVGAGLGLVQGKLSAQAHDSAGINGGIVDHPNCLGAINGICTVNDKATTWGWQLLAGAGYEVADNLFWDTHYSYMKADAGGLDFDGSFAPQLANGFPAAFIHDTELNDVGSHTVMTGLRYKFGNSRPTPPPVPAPTPDYTCWNGDVVFNASNCAARPEPTPAPVTVIYDSCWDGSQVERGTACPARPEPTYVTCEDGTQVTDAAFCVATPVVVNTASYNNCGPSNVAIFNVPVNTTPKQMSRLGTMPEFGDSHGLSPNQFFEKLQAKYSSSATDKAYLNYLFKSMGYANGFADAQSYMFSEEVLPVGTTGMLGLGEQHHYKYSVLPSNDRDRQAFRIQSANGSIIHFMKTCGNYMYACN